MDSSFNLIPFVKQIIEDQVAVIFNKELSKKFNKESIEFSVPCKFEFPPDETMGHRQQK